MVLPDMEALSSHLPDVVTCPRERAKGGAVSHAVSPRKPRASPKTFSSPGAAGSLHSILSPDSRVERLGKTLQVDGD